MDAAVVCTDCNWAFTDDFGLIHEGYWPGTTTGRSPYMFDQDVFRFFSVLRLHSPGVSYSAFIKTLEQLSVEKGRVSVYIPTYVVCICICTFIMKFISPLGAYY